MGHFCRRITKAAIREVQEEIGLTLQHNELVKIGTRKHMISHPNGIQDNEFHHVFIAELKAPIEQLTIQQEEVAELKLFELATLKNTKKLENVLLPRFHEYYCFVYDKVIEQL